MSVFRVQESTLKWREAFDLLTQFDLEVHRYVTKMDEVNGGEMYFFSIFYMMQNTLIIQLICISGETKGRTRVLLKGTKIKSKLKASICLVDLLNIE